MEQLFFILHIIFAAVLIILILIQQGKGAEAGASFGAGASQTVFGSQGSGSFITRITATFATLFFVSSLTLGYFALQANKAKSIDEIADKIKSSPTEPHSHSTAPAEEISQPLQNPLSTQDIDNSNRGDSQDIPSLPTSPH